jgi:hypothetical protein
MIMIRPFVYHASSSFRSARTPVKDLSTFFQCPQCRKEHRVNIKRREFLGFFLVGGLVSLVLRKLGLKVHVQEKEAMFWRRKA